MFHFRTYLNFRSLTWEQFFEKLKKCQTSLKVNGFMEIDYPIQDIVIAELKKPFFQCRMCVLHETDTTFFNTKYKHSNACA